MNLSAFTSILKVLINVSSQESFEEIESLLRDVLAEHSVLQPSSFSAILSSFESSNAESLQHQLTFFDNCACRIAKKPVHYQDLLQPLVDNSQPLSPLVAAVIEQWPFVRKVGNAEAEKIVGEFIANLLRKLHSVGESLQGLKAARDELVNATEDKKLKSTFKKTFKGSEENEKGEEITKPEPTAQTAPSSRKGWQDLDLEGTFGSLPAEGKTHKELYRWEQRELDESLEGGRIAELFLCVCSQHEEVRRQSLPNISRFMMKLKVRSLTPLLSRY